MKKLLLLVPALSLVLGSCYYDKASELYPSSNGGTCVLTDVTYSKIVKTIITNNCALSGCHDAATPSNGYDFTSYTGVKLAVDNNLLLGTIMHSSGFVAMPQGTSKLPDCSISQISAWVAAGALNN